MKKLDSWKLFISLYIISSIVFLFPLMKLGILPMMYIAVIAIVLLLIAFILYKVMVKEGKHYISKCLSLLLSVVLVVGSMTLFKADSTLNKVTKPNNKSSHYALVVLKDSSIKDVKDLEGSIIEYCNEYEEKDTMKNVIEKVENKNLVYNEVDKYIDLANHLYDGSTKAILVNTAYHGVFEEKYPEFTNDTKEIWSCSIDLGKIDIAKKVDTKKETFSIYVSGIDTTGPISTISRSDVNLIVTVNPNAKQILITSIPRDAYVTLANKGQKDKLTHSGLAGVDNTVKTVENWLGIEINYYARVNFTSLINIVDTLGGVDVESAYDFTSMHGRYTFHKGMNHVNGNQALGFVRERYSLPNGDYDRGQNQQRLLKAIFNKAISPSIITRYNDVLDAVSGSVETNMPASDMTALVQKQLDTSSKPWTIMTNQIVGTGVYQKGGAYMPSSRLYYMIPNEQSVNEVKTAISKMQNEEEITVENPAN